MYYYLWTFCFLRGDLSAKDLEDWKESVANGRALPRQFTRANNTTSLVRDSTPSALNQINRVGYRAGESPGRGGIVFRKWDCLGLFSNAFCVQLWQVMRNNLLGLIQFGFTNDLSDRILKV